MHKLTIDHLVLAEEQHRFTIRKSAQEFWLGFCFCLLFSPLFGLLGGWLLLAELQHPGKLGADVFQDTFGIGLNLQRSAHFFVAVSSSLLTILVLALLTMFCGREVYRAIRYGRRPWIFDRNRDLFSLGAKPIRSISGIRQVRISRLRVRFRRQYYVGFSPDDKPVTETLFIGLRDDVFVLTSERKAADFATRIASFLQVGVAKDYE